MFHTNHWYHWHTREVDAPCGVRFAALGWTVLRDGAVFGPPFFWLTPLPRAGWPAPHERHWTAHHAMVAKLLMALGMSADGVKELDMRTKRGLNKIGVDRDVLLGSVPIVCCWCLYWGQGVATFIVISVMLFTLAVTGYIQSNPPPAKTGSQFINPEEAAANASDAAAAAAGGGAADTADAEGEDGASDDEEEVDEDTKKGQ